MTDGFDVFVQLVIAAITAAPSSSRTVSPSSTTSTPRRVLAGATAAPAPAPDAVLLPPTSVSRYCRNDGFTSERSSRSCGRRGPATLGSTVERSSEIGRAACRASGDVAGGARGG